MTHPHLPDLEPQEPDYLPRPPRGGNSQKRRRPFILLVALALIGQPAWSSGLAQEGLDDPQVTGDTFNNCLDRSILSAFLSFRCHVPNGYIEPEGDEPSKPREKPKPPKCSMMHWEIDSQYALGVKPEKQCA